MPICEGVCVCERDRLTRRQPRVISVSPSECPDVTGREKQKKISAPALTDEAPLSLDNMRTRLSTFAQRVSLKVKLSGCQAATTMR